MEEVRTVGLVGGVVKVAVGEGAKEKVGLAHAEMVNNGGTADEKVDQHALNELGGEPFILKRNELYKRWREKCAQSAGGGLSEHGSSGEGVQLDQVTRESTQRDESTEKRDGGGKGGTGESTMGVTIEALPGTCI